MKRKTRRLAAVLAAAAMLTTGLSMNAFSVNALTVIAQIEEIRSEKTVIAVGETAAVEVIWDNITGSTGAKTGLYFTSDQPDVAAVDSDGNITGISPGTAVITAVNSPSEKSLTVTVTDGTAAPEENLPDWIPQNFTEALKFNNQYGRTHIENGVLCYVWQENDDTSYEITDTLVTGALVRDISYEYTAPEKPDESDFEAYMKYLNELYDIGLDPYFVENGFEPDYTYRVMVYRPDTNIDAEFSIECASTWNGYEKPNNIETLSFQVNDGELTETDIFGWLPDCITEYDAFLAKNGVASVHDNYVVYCADINYSTGATLSMIQNGETELELIRKSDCNKACVADLAAGNTSYAVNVYQADSDGIADVTWIVGREWDPESPADRSTKKTYQVTENGSVIADITAPELMGDVNADGEFNIADAVQFNRWLLGSADIALADWKAADFCNDGKLDGFDLTLMKKALLDAE